MDVIPPAPAPTPLSLTPARFSLPRAGWIVWGLYAALNVVLILIRKGPADPYHTGQFVGSVVAALLFPALVAWVVWRVSGRSTLSGNITFFVVFGLAVLGQL